MAGSKFKRDRDGPISWTGDSFLLVFFSLDSSRKLERSEANGNWEQRAVDRNNPISFPDFRPPSKNPRNPVEIHKPML